MTNAWMALTFAGLSLAFAPPVFADSYSVKTFSEQPLFLNDAGDVLFANNTILHANGSTSAFSNPPGTCLPDNGCYDQVAGFNSKDQVLWTRQSWAYFQLTNNSWRQLDTNENIINGGQNNTGNNQNNAGQIIGRGSQGAFIYRNGQYDVPKNAPVGYMFTSLNDAGQAVGFSNNDTTNIFIDYLYSNGKLTKIANPGAATDFGYPDSVISQTGAVADVSSKGFFLYQNGKYHDINLPLSSNVKSIDSIAGIDNAGQVLLSYTNAVGREQFYLYSNGQFILMNDPGSKAGTTEIYGITPSGELVGESSSGEFTYESGVYTAFTVPGFFNPTILSVNAEGEILGSSPGFQQPYFLAAPEAAPEPGSLLLVLAGSAIAGIFHFKNKGATRRPR